MYALCKQKRLECAVRLLKYFKDLTCDTYNTWTFVMDSAATKISALLSTHSHTDIVPYSFHFPGALFRKISISCTNHLVMFINPDVCKRLKHLVKTRRSDL
ncbi:hypothetical protein Smp_051050 [Schistosoma mansoni]|uniref:hypothetical protein n=1 Tax=Schistosoma mansoni TaxID=6183 RepID=UPI0001A63F15|nr:hypothetical protein Smp_051050 [Schistosoma mansoni]|eukprot:XP_018653304.1 hypothetical protein Smp_051050 [Schistosoma mansoni]